MRNSQNAFLRQQGLELLLRQLQKRSPVVTLLRRIRFHASQLQQVPVFDLLPGAVHLELRLTVAALHSIISCTRAKILVAMRIPFSASDTEPNDASDHWIASIF